MEQKEPAGCARCPVEPPVCVCQNEEGKAPPFCPTANGSGAIRKAQAEPEKPEIREFARQASVQEGEGYAGRSTLPVQCKFACGF